MRLQRRWMSGVAHMREIVRTQLDGIKEAGTWKNERVITSPQANFVSVQGSDQQLLNFCANNYLGLSVSSWYILLSRRLEESFSNIPRMISSTLLNW